MTFDRDEEWNKHLEKFHHLATKLAPYDHSLSSKDKVSKLIKILPVRLALIAMVSKDSRVQLQKITSSIQTEISRQKPQGSIKNILTFFASAFSKRNNEGRRNQSKVLNARKDICFVCGKTEHYANKCWYRMNNTFSGRGRLGRRGFSRGSRERGFITHHQFGDNSNFRSTEGQRTVILCRTKIIIRRQFKVNQMMGRRAVVTGPA